MDDGIELSMDDFRLRDALIFLPIVIPLGMVGLIIGVWVFFVHGNR